MELGYFSAPFGRFLWKASGLVILCWGVSNHRFSPLDCCRAVTFSVSCGAQRGSLCFQEVSVLSKLSDLFMLSGGFNKESVLFHGSCGLCGTCQFPHL